mmetsp:Transcript_29609/g.85768  ORF Transcript_29609/g.85768 Transcript_29609/m.85768 type:complete len:202 (-) Transcript_29609:426-1031(-)
MGCIPLSSSSVKTDASRSPAAFVIRSRAAGVRYWSSATANSRSSDTPTTPAQLHCGSRRTSMRSHLSFSRQYWRLSASRPAPASSSTRSTPAAHTAARWYLASSWTRARRWPSTVTVAFASAPWQKRCRAADAVISSQATPMHSRRVASLAASVKPMVMGRSCVDAWIFTVLGSVVIWPCVVGRAVKGVGDWMAFSDEKGA